MLIMVLAISESLYFYVKVKQTHTLTKYTEQNVSTQEKLQGDIILLPICWKKLECR